jgi:hypothetical protein
VTKEVAQAKEGSEADEKSEQSKVLQQPGTTWTHRGLARSGWQYGTYRKNYQEINILRAAGDFSHLQVPKGVTNMEREQARMNLQY